MRVSEASPLLALDLESVLVPEIWHAVAAHAGVPELRRTTRDEKDYSSLMAFRIELCRRHGLSLRRLRAIVADLEPLPGARSFLSWVRPRLPVAILSDSFYELAEPLMCQLGLPLLLCHRLQVDADGFVSGIRLRQDEAKGTAARAFRQMGYWVIAVGDSFNDVQMLHHADCGMWLDPPPALAARYPELPCLSSLSEVRARLEEELRGLCID